MTVLLADLENSTTQQTQTVLFAILHTAKLQMASIGVIGKSCLVIHDPAFAWELGLYKYKLP